MKSFDIIIVNWNSGNQLKECIESVNKAVKNNRILNQVIIVDNASSDDSIAKIEDSNLTKELNIKIIKNKSNLGFAKACNIGAKKVNGDFILFLNPDVIVFEDTFEKLFDYINKYNEQDIGIYGIQLLDKNGNIQRTCARFPTLWNFYVKSLGLNKINPKIFRSYTMEYWNHKETIIVNHVIGAFYLIKRSLFNEINGFDEQYFVYLEDLDLSKRIADFGFKTKYIVESKAYHKGGGTSNQVKATRLFYSLRSRLLYGFKHFPLWQAWSLVVITLVLEPVSRTVFSLLRGSISDILNTWRGYRMLYHDFPNIIKSTCEQEAK